MADGGGEEEVPPEFECSICMKLMMDPVSVSCGHTFCRTCLEKSLGYRGLCAVCRAPVVAGQGVNVLVRSIIAERFPRALAARRLEAEDELRAGEQAADEARRREVQGTGAAAALGAGAGGAAPVLPLIQGYSGLVILPHGPAEVELRSQEEERLIEYALQGGRRLGILDGTCEGYDEAARPMGVCFEVEGVDRGPNRRTRVRLAGKFRFWLTEPPQPHENGFPLGRCDAFFDEALPVSDLLIGGTDDAPAATGEEQEVVVDGEEQEVASVVTTAELARDALALLEAQLVHVGHSGRRVFGERFGDIPAAPRVGQPVTSASLEKLSFWFLGALLTTESERRQWLGSVDTRARLEHCGVRMEAAGRRPVLNLPGAGSWMSPGQSAFKSFALLVVIIALFVAKASGYLEPGAFQQKGRHQHQRQRYQDGAHEDHMIDAFASWQLLR